MILDEDVLAWTPEALGRFGNYISPGLPRVLSISRYKSRLNFLDYICLQGIYVDRWLSLVSYVSLGIAIPITHNFFLHPWMPRWDICLLRGLVYKAFDVSRVYILPPSCGHFIKLFSTLPLRPFQRGHLVHQAWPQTHQTLSVSLTSKVSSICTTRI